MGGGDGCPAAGDTIARFTFPLWLDSRSWIGILGAQIRTNRHTDLYSWSFQTMMPMAIPARKMTKITTKVLETGMVAYS